MSKEITTTQLADKVLDKSETLIIKATETASSIFEAASNIITKAAMEYGPTAIDALLTVVRIDAAQKIIYGIIALLLIIVPLKVNKYFKSKINELHEEYRGSSDYNFGIFVMRVFGIVLFYFGINTLANIWLYVAIVKPELYLVKQAVDITKEKLENSAKSKK